MLCGRHTTNSQFLSVTCGNDPSHPIAKRPNVFNPRQVVAVQPRDNFIPYAAHNQHIILAQLRDNNAEFWLAVFTIHFSVFSDARIHAERHDIAHIKYRVNRRLTPIFHPTPKTTDYTWHWSQLQLLLIFLLTFKNIGLPVIRTADLSQTICNWAIYM